MKFPTCLIFLEMILVSHPTNGFLGKISKIFPKSVVNFVTPSFLHEKVLIKDGILIKSLEVPNDTEESGSLDFLGRDLLNAISKANSKISEFTGNINSFIGDNLGLDTNSKFFNGSSADGLKNHIKAIFPGTKWCGDGDIAKTYEDLGIFESLDKCCRDHDKCPDSIPAGGTKYGLINKGIFTRSLCECDWEFYVCLKQAHNVPSYQIGFTYFSVLGPQCFKEELRKIACGGYKMGKCTSYQFDPNSTYTYQWFDSPPF